MSDHTPGPWRVEQESSNDGEAEVIAAADRTICWTADTWVDDDCGVITDEDRANARLIAAAPELLAALKEMVMLRCLGGATPDNDSPTQRAVIVINKAEGEGE